MVEVLDLNLYWKALADQRALTADEAQQLLRMTEHFQSATAYLADCQAATAEGLPAATSKSARQRHVALCTSAAKLLAGDSTPIRYPTSVETAQNRCMRAAERATSKQA